ncbi:sulfur carrier protein ThiS [Anaerofustis sp.]|uniref:sulfur carrier protein ThiS n=1 Tax=Anaerofustis sp. TaxID=1872517 RepID=UPI0025B7B95E|nr:sulfur carrier protein ThiS [Anaerofustis sp.]
MIKVNGEILNFENISLKELLSILKYDIKKIAVEINEEIISKKDFDNVIVKENDKIEIVNFVGGG